MNKFKRIIAVFMAGFILSLAAVSCAGDYEQVSSPGTSEVVIETTTVPTTIETTTTTETTLPATTTVPYKVSTTTTKLPTTTTTVVVESVEQEPVNNYVATNAFLECVKHRESRGNYSAVNPSSGAGGAYQFLQTTWNNTAAHIGRYDLVGVHPSQASPADQDLMANALLNWYGTSPWAGPGC